MSFHENFSHFEKYLVIFSSNKFDESDPSHLKKPQNTSIYYSYTSDFIDFTAAQLYYSVPNGGLTDMTIHNVGNDTYVRFFRDDTDGVLKVRGQVSRKGLWGEYASSRARSYLRHVR